MKPYYHHQGITIYHGNSKEIIHDLAFDSIVTDPPYGMDFRSNWPEEKWDKIENDHDSELLKWICELSTLHSKYIFGRWDNLKEIIQPKSVITWIKNNHSMGDLEHEHARQTELIFFYQGQYHSWSNGRPTDVICSDRTQNQLHPTEKPLPLLTKICSWAGNIICDPFMGSGTTLRAAKDLNKQAIGIEIKEKYCEIAAKRLSQEVFNFK